MDTPKPTDPEPPAPPPAPTDETRSAPAEGGSGGTPLAAPAAQSRPGSATLPPQRGSGVSPLTGPSFVARAPVPESGAGEGGAGVPPATGPVPPLDLDRAGMGIEEFLAAQGLDADIELVSSDATLSGTAPPVEAPVRGQRYRVGRLIAHGGMGAVLRVHDLNCRRLMAMKVMLQRSGLKPEQVVRFIREARITAQLEHPAIVPVHDLGVDATGNVYYTMKLIEGVSLGTILKGLLSGDAATVGKYPLGRLLGIFLKACDAIAFAHSRGVVHRDLKPDNIMVSDYGEVLVVDWGLAKVLKGSALGVPSGLGARHASAGPVPADALGVPQATAAPAECSVPGTPSASSAPAECSDASVGADRRAATLGAPSASSAPAEERPEVGRRPTLPASASSVPVAECGSRPLDGDAGSAGILPAPAGREGGSRPLDGDVAENLKSKSEISDQAAGQAPIPPTLTAAESGRVRPPLAAQSRDGSATMPQEGGSGVPATRNLTLDGQVLGTPRYMAPEQALGRVTDQDARTDIYSLGAILYELLTLHPPIAGGVAVQVLLHVADGKIIPPETWTRAAPETGATGSFPHCPDGKYPESLAAVALKALALHRKDRYQTVGELQAEVEAYQGGFATRAEQASFARQAWLLVKRHKALTGVLALLLVLVFGGLAGGLYTKTLQQRQAAAEADSAKAKLALIEEEKRKQEDWLPVCDLDFSRDTKLPEQFEVLFCPKETLLTAGRKPVSAPQAAHIADGVLHMTGDVPGLGRGLTVLRWREPIGEDVRIEAAVAHAEGGSIGFAVCGDSFDGYRVVSVMGAAGSIAVDTIATTRLEPFQTYGQPTPDPGTAHEYVVEKKGQFIRAWVDGRKGIEYFLPVPPTGERNQTFSLSVYCGPTRVHALRVSKRKAPELVPILEIGRAFIRRKDFAAAEDFFREVAKSHAGTSSVGTEAQYLLGVALQYEGRKDEALAAFEALGAVVGRSAGVAGSDDRGSSEAQRAIRAAAGSSLAQAARMLAEAGDFAKAISIAARATRVDPQSTVANEVRNLFQTKLSPEARADVFRGLSSEDRAFGLTCVAASKCLDFAGTDLADLSFLLDTPLKFAGLKNTPAARAILADVLGPSEGTPGAALPSDQTRQFLSAVGDGVEFYLGVLDYAYEHRRISELSRLGDEAPATKPWLRPFWPEFRDARQFVRDYPRAEPPQFLLRSEEDREKWVVTSTGEVRFTNGALDLTSAAGQGTSVSHPRRSRDILIRATACKLAGQHLALRARENPRGRALAWFNGGTSFGFCSSTKPGDLGYGTPRYPCDGYFDFAFAAHGKTLRAWVNGRLLMEVQDEWCEPGMAGLSVYNQGCAIFRNIAIQRLEPEEAHP